MFHPLRHPWHQSNSGDFKKKKKFHPNPISQIFATLFNDNENKFGHVPTISNGKTS